MAKPKKAVKAGKKSGATNKNPLSQALGIVLRKNRLILHPEPNAIADAIGVEPSYYRAVEAGTYNMHISNALKLCEAFSGRFSYEGVQKILSTISIIDVTTKEEMSVNNANYFDALSGVFQKIGEQDERIKVLFQKFSENDFLNKIKKLSHDEVSKAISENRLDAVVENFLTNYKSFGKSPVETQSSYPETFFNDIPTDKIELFEKIKEFTKEQSASYNYRMSWSWEEKNKHLFTKCFILDIHPELITGFENLEKYRYEYLWQPNFEKVCMIFVSDESADIFKANFTANLKRSLEKCDNDVSRTMLENFDEVVSSRVEIKCISKTHKDFHIVQSIFEIKDKKIGYNSTWIFSFASQFNVGVCAKFENNDPKFGFGDYLTFKETLTMAREFTKLWKRI